MVKKGKGTDCRQRTKAGQGTVGDRAAPVPSDGPSGGLIKGVAIQAATGSEGKSFMGCWGAQPVLPWHPLRIGWRVSVKDPSLLNIFTVGPRVGEQTTSKHRTRVPPRRSLQGRQWRAAAQQSEFQKPRTVEVS